MSDGSQRAKAKQVHARPPAALHLLTVLLTVATGAMDAICFLELGDVFASVMTGNVVLLGLAAGNADGALAVHTGVALASFGVATLLGSLTAGRHRAPSGRRVWPARTTAAFAVEATALSVFLLLWILRGPEIAGAEELVLLALAAFAMGTQSAVVNQLDVPGGSTTYITGTLTRLLSGTITRLVTGGQGGWVERWAAARLAALIAGAAGAALLVATASSMAPVLPLALLTVVIVVALLPIVRADAPPAPKTGDGARR
ncbi:MAG TPA: YoaK family protein [Nocardioidaceae bacterium]|nr:YoaK family protein [Nocardioidaceae bacterium]